MATKVTSEFNTQTSGINERQLADTLPDVSPHHIPDSPKRIRLLVGEGDFSFATALLERHTFSGDIIIATEIRQRDQLINMYGNRMEETLTNLQELGVKLMFGVDATKLHERFQHVRRIYFNFPYTNVPVTRYEPSDTARMLKEFFASAAKVQEIGDRILLTLVYKDDERGQEWWHGHLYGIEAAAHTNRYKLVGKRRFSNPEKGNRYSNYTHRETNRSDSSENWKNARQYVFERVVDSSQCKSRTKSGRVGHMDVTYFENMETNSDTDTDTDIPSPHTTDSDVKQSPINIRSYTDECVFFIQCLLYSASRGEGTNKQKRDLEHLVLSVLHSIGITCQDLGRILMLKGTNIKNSQEKGQLDIKLCASILGYKEKRDNEESTVDDKQSTAKEKDDIALSTLHTTGRWLFDIMVYFPTFDVSFVIDLDEPALPLPIDEDTKLTYEPDPTFVSTMDWEELDDAMKQAIRNHASMPNSWRAETVGDVNVVILNTYHGGRVVAFSKNRVERYVIFAYSSHDAYERNLRRKVRAMQALCDATRQQFPNQANLHNVELLTQLIPTDRLLTFD